ncbi:MAG TPA: DUF748 domain-containing protein [Methylomirabilota bacterium]
MTRRRFWSTVAVVVLAVLVVSATALWLALPRLARWAMVRQVEAQTGRRLTMARFDLDLRHGRLHIAGLRLEDRVPGPPLVEFDRLDVRFHPTRLLRGHLEIVDVSLAGPRVHIVRIGRGELNISDLLARPASRSESPPFTLDHLAVTDGAILFEDRTLTPTRIWRAEPLTVEAEALSSASPEPRGRLRIATTVAGAPFSLDASGIALRPLQAKARVSLRDADATLANLYLPADTMVVLERAVAGAVVDATIDAQGGVGLDGQARVADVVARRRGVDASLFTVPALTVTLKSGRSPEGRLVDRVEVNGQATVFDPRPGKSNRFEIQRIRVVAEGLDATGRSSARLTASAALPGGGALDVQGTARATPAAAEVRTRISKVDLAFWAPYFSLPVEFTGMAETDLTVDTAPAGPRVRGRALVKGVTVSEGTRRLAAADQLELSGLDAQWPKAKVERVTLGRPRARIGRDRDGRLTIAELVESMKKPAGERPAEPIQKPSPLPPDFAIEVGEVSVENGRLRLDDATVEPAAAFRLAPIRLNARTLTWPSRGPATVKLSAGTPGGGTVETEGTVRLDPVRFDLRTRLVNVAVAPYRPYAPLAARVDGHVEGDLTAKGTVGGGKTELAAKGSLALADLAFIDGDRPILTVGRLELTGLDYTWPATATIDRVHMRKSWALLERRPDGSMPITGILTPLRRTPAPGAPSDAPAAAPSSAAPSASSASPPAATTPPPASPLPEIKMTAREVLFEDGAATVVDAAVNPTARLEVNGVRLSVRDFAWPARAPVPVQLEAPTPGAGRITARGTLDLTTQSLQMQITPAGVDLGPAQPYLPVRGRLTGQASGDLTLQATLQPWSLTARGAAAIADMALGEAGKPLMTAARLQATGIDYAWPATVTVDRIDLQKPWAQIEQAADGSFPLRALLEPPAPAPGAPPPRDAPGAGGATPLDLRVRRAGVDGGVFELIDSTVRPTARAQIHDARLTIRNFTWPAREPSALRLRATTGTGGTVDARGDMRLDTRAIDLQLAIKQLDVAIAQTFVPGRASLAGKLDADLRVKGTLAPLSVAATGRVAVDDPILGDGRRMLGYVKRVDMDGIDADWPRRVDIRRMALDQPWALVERDADGGFPLIDLLTPSAPSTAPPAPASPRREAPSPGPRPPGEGALPVITLGEVTISEGFVRFVDHTTRPAFAEEASRIALDGRGLTTARTGKGRLTLAGRLTGGAPFELKGSLGGLGGPVNLDLEGKLTDFPLPRVNPYINEMIGWIARRGAFGGTVRYRVVDDVLTASNDIVLGQPDFAPSRRGDEVRDRVGVPLGTLIALLKNAKGEVRLAVPVTGNVATRQFDFTEAFWDAMRKTAVGVISLPVSWVGKIFYSEDARVETIQIWPVYFEAGTTSFAPGFDRHAERLGGFLRDSPGVNLAMKSVLTVDDIAALKRDAVRRRIEAAGRETPGGVAAAAARLYTERHPGHTPPGDVEAIVSDLVEDEPNPDAAAKALSAQRMAVTRAQLEKAARVAPERLRVTEGLVPVEGSGLGRVEFEIAP